MSLPPEKNASSPPPGAHLSQSCFQLSSVVTTMQGLAATLVELCEHMASSQHPPSLVSSTRSAAQALAYPSQQDFKDEVRSYNYSSMAVMKEQALFKQYDVDCLHALLFEAYSSLVALRSLMEKIDVEAAVEGGVLHILGRQLKGTEDLLFHLQDMYQNVSRIEL